jgi:hypothetical protein
MRSATTQPRGGFGLVGYYGFIGQPYAGSTGHSPQLVLGGFIRPFQRTKCSPYRTLHELAFPDSCMEPNTTSLGVLVHYERVLILVVNDLAKGLSVMAST